MFKFKAVLQICPTPAAPDPAALRGRLGEGRAKIALPAGFWVVVAGHVSQPVGNRRTALKYLAPYVFRVAISNRRLVKPENNQVTFRYRATDTGQLKLCTLSAEAFIHCFLHEVLLTAHVLPKGFVKVRYFGFFAPGCRKRLAALRQLLVHKFPEHVGEAEAESEPTDSSPEPKLRCPSCGQPLQFQHTIQPTGRCPQ